jgi:hypothetical protein
MKYNFEMDSAAMMHIPSFLKTGSSVQKLLRGGDSQNRAWRSHMPTVGK